MAIETNGGALVANHKGPVKNCGWVWCHPEAFADVLSLSDAKRKCRVTHDSGRDNEFVVHKPDEKVHFAESGNGLFCHDVHDR